MKYLLILVVVGQFWNTHSEPSFATHRSLSIPNEQLQKINDLSDTAEFKKTLEPILIPRIVGTEGHAKVKDYIVNFMKKLNWSVELDSFEDMTPNMGQLTFHNIIAKLNPDAKRYLLLACHYDSKYMKGEEFIGAIDSAVPCAMLLHMADRLNAYFEDTKDVSLMFVFFDGEEAFQEWGPTDSIYGARHLAARWKKEDFLPKIDLLCLLDLLGAADPVLFSFFSGTDKWHLSLVDAESKMSSGGFLNNSKGNTVSKRSNDNIYFQARSVRSYIEDDHIPFLHSGVPVLHLIPVPFPKVWHTVDDNRNVIDYKTVEDLCKILNVFVLEYLNIPVGNKG
ncbi:QPCT family protein [Megaselia abdita]